MKLAANCPINLPTLLETRLLVQANSGGGKSYALRKLFEETAPAVQQLIIDPDGEFASLRGHYDYVIAAPRGGDVVAHPSSAAVLARRLLELGVSAVLDIYELTSDDRQRFVAAFLDALTNAPRELWKPVMVALDEAHVYCPQNGSAIATDAVKDMATRGRKRGQGLVLATQRLSKLHKDVAAEMLNKLIGRTQLDVDVKRAADELGLNARDAMKELRPLKPGEFYAFGPAFALKDNGIEKIKIGAVKTSHPKPGSRMMQAPPTPSAAIKKQLGKLGDLAQQAKREAKTMEDLRAEILELKKAAKAPAVDAKALAEKYELGQLEERKNFARAGTKFLKDLERARDGTFSAIETAIAALTKAKNPFDTLAWPFDLAPAPSPLMQHAAKVMQRANDSAKDLADFQLRMPAFERAPAKPSGSASERIIASLNWWRAAGVEHPTREQVAFVAGYSVNGHFRNMLGGLKTSGDIDYRPGGRVVLEPALRKDFDRPSYSELIDRVRGVIRNASERKIFDAVEESTRIYVKTNSNAIMTRETVAERAGYTVNGHFRNMLGHLVTLGALKYPSRGYVALGDFIEGFKE